MASSHPSNKTSISSHWDGLAQPDTVSDALSHTTNSSTSAAPSSVGRVGTAQQTNVWFPFVSKLSPKAVHKLAWNYVRFVVPGWELIERPEDITVTEMHGGLTNKLFAVKAREPSVSSSSSSSTKDAWIRKVVIRFFGKDTDLYFARDLELTVSRCLSEMGWGPRIFDEFDESGGGRVEAFISGVTLRYEDLSQESMARYIAHEMAALHGLKIPITWKQPVLITNLRLWVKNLKDTSFAALSCAQATATASSSSSSSSSVAVGSACPGTCIGVIHTLNEMKQQQAPVQRWLRTTGGNRVLKSSISLQELQQEVRFVVFSFKRQRLPVVFCHNDLQEGNFIWDKERRRMNVIDYEYANWNYRAFDIGNHFCEQYIDNQYPQSPYFRLDEAYFPSTEQRLSFVREYLAAQLLLQQDPYKGSTDSNDTPSAQARREHDLLRETEWGMLASHLMWSLWSLLQSYGSDIQFDYITYALSRMQEYYRLKALLTTKGPSGTPGRVGKGDVDSQTPRPRL